jgi:pimeloyl-ACP methyl ester carboxylesterase
MQDRSKKPGELDELQRLIPGSRVVRVENSGHYVQEEQPLAVAAAMIAAAPGWL